MTTPNVWHYEVTYCDSGGMQYTRTRGFSQAQADEVGAVLEPDGVNIVAAQRLCEKWTRHGNRGGIRYTYRIPFCKAPDAMRRALPREMG